MEYASDWKQTEADRRTKLRKFMDELGLPEQVHHAEDGSGYPEVEEDEKLPWNYTDGILDKS
jgi:hypothetical protein